MEKYREGEQYNFSNYPIRDAAVLKSRILLFATAPEPQTYILEREENSEKIEVVGGL